MALWQAILCGVFYYLNAGPWVCGIGFYTFGRPMVLGFFVGLILGDPITGTVVGDNSVDLSGSDVYRRFLSG